MKQVVRKRIWKCCGLGSLLFVILLVWLQLHDLYASYIWHKGHGNNILFGKYSLHIPNQWYLTDYVDGEKAFIQLRFHPIYQRSTVVAIHFIGIDELNRSEHDLNEFTTRFAESKRNMSHANSSAIQIRSADMNYYCVKFTDDDLVYDIDCRAVSSPYRVQAVWQDKNDEDKIIELIKGFKLTP